MEKEIDLLDRVWSLVKEWQTLYSSWKDGAFVDIEVRACMGAEARVFASSEACLCTAVRTGKPIETTWSRPNPKHAP